MTSRQSLLPEALEPNPKTAPRENSPNRLRALFKVIMAAAMVSTPSFARAEDGEKPMPAAPKKNGTLIIAGGGENLPREIHDCFVERAGGKTADIVVFSTASRTADEPDQKFGRYWKGPAENVASVKLLHTRNPEEANKPTFTEPLKKAKGVWFSGGDQSLVAEAYLRTIVHDELQRILHEGGVVAGTSAGAAVLSKPMFKGNRVPLGEGFGLTPPHWLVDQHFKQRDRFNIRMKPTLEQRPEFLGVGVDEDTALVVTGHEGFVLGDGNVSICKANGEPLLLKRGQRMNFKTMSVISPEVRGGE